jgi:PPOX class probable F420-dependent enzyme
MNFPAEFLDLLQDEAKAFLYLATIMPDDSPQVTPVWFSADSEYILINTAEGRIKDRNMKARPKVALTIQDPKNPYRYLGLRGEVVSHTREGADDHINALSFKYMGTAYKIPPGQKRIIFRIRPTHFDLHNS